MQKHLVGQVAYGIILPIYCLCLGQAIVRIPTDQPVSLNAASFFLKWNAHVRGEHNERSGRDVWAPNPKNGSSESQQKSVER